MQSTISGEIFKQTAFGTSVCIPLALFIGVRAKKHGVIGTMINGNPEAVWAQRKEPLTQLWDVLYNLAPFTTPSHCATPLWHQCSKVFAHATSSICFMLQALLPFSTWQTPTHPTRFTLNFHFLSKAFPSPLGRVGHMLLQAPTASCSSPTSLNHCGVGWLGFSAGMRERSASKLIQHFGRILNAVGLRFLFSGWQSAVAFLCS